jgi:hypothetical protein
MVGHITTDTKLTWNEHFRFSKKARTLFFYTRAIRFSYLRCLSCLCATRRPHLRFFFGSFQNVVFLFHIQIVSDQSGWTWRWRTIRAKEWCVSYLGWRLWILISCHSSELICFFLFLLSKTIWSQSWSHSLCDKARCHTRFLGLCDISSHFCHIFIL